MSKDRESRLTLKEVTCQRHKGSRENFHLGSSLKGGKGVLDLRIIN